MFCRGLVDEVRSLLSEGVPPESHALKAIGYRECLKVLSGEWVEEEALEQTEIATRRFAKRQLTWLRTERDLVWISGHATGLTERVVEIVEGSSGSGQ